MMIKNQRTKKRLLTLSAMCCIGPALEVTDVMASPEKPSIPIVSVGVAAISKNAAYRGTKSDLFLVPAISYEGENLYLRGAGLGYRLIKTKHRELAVALDISPQRFSPKKNKIDALRKLDARDFRIETGFKLTERTAIGRFNVQGSVNLRDIDTGYKASVSYFYPFNKQSRYWQLGPKVELSYLSSDYGNYFYGISSKEAQRSGLSEYQTGSSWNTSIGIDGYMALNKRWMLAGSLSRRFIDNSIQNSPMTDGKHATSVFLFLTYRL